MLRSNNRVSRTLSLSRDAFHKSLVLSNKTRTGARLASMLQHLIDHLLDAQTGGMVVLDIQQTGALRVAPKHSKRFCLGKNLFSASFSG